MTKEDKELLLKDLCARLPYGFVIYRESDNSNIKINYIDDFFHFLDFSDGEDFKPYLRPMSSMTDEEKEEFDNLYNWSCPNSKFLRTKIIDVSELIDWLNAHHFDYRGLIERKLALEAPEDIYKI